MRKHLKNYLIPHEGNSHRPHLLREASVVMLAIVIVFVFGFSVFRGLVVNRGAEYTAAVLPNVLVELANNDREDEGLGNLSVNETLQEAARMKAEHMAENGYFAHVSPDGLDPWYWFYRAGYEFVDAGENLAVNFVDSEDVETAWMNSPGHRANILNGKYTEIGIAAVKGEYKGKNTIYVVQLFGRPAEPTFTGAVSSQPELATTEPEEVAGAGVAITPTNPEPDIILVKEDVTAHAEGVRPAVALAADEEALAPDKSAEATMWETVASQPRAIVSWSYLLIGLLISFVLLSMVFMQVHRQHPRSVVYGIALLSLIGLLSYLNWLLLSAELVIV